MKVIMIKSVPNIGQEGAIVEVKDGFARNYLIPQGFAQPATGQSLRYHAHLRSSREKQKDHKMRQAQETGEKLAVLALTIAKPVGENDRLFGTVTHKDIAEALAKEGLDIDRRVIVIEDPIKCLGSYVVTVKLHAQVQVPLKVDVVREQ